ncbi:MAG: hypothetical protein WKF57_07530 [Nakamurella sp.]
MPEHSPLGIHDDIADGAHVGAHRSASENRMFETVEQLHAEFGPGPARLLVLAVVEVCRDQLDAAPAGQRPSLLAQLTRQRALRASDGPATSAGDPRPGW